MSTILERLQGKAGTTTAPASSYAQSTVLDRLRSQQTDTTPQTQQNLYEQAVRRTPRHSQSSHGSLYAPEIARQQAAMPTLYSGGAAPTEDQIAAGAAVHQQRQQVQEEAEQSFLRRAWNAIMTGAAMSQNAGAGYLSPAAMRQTAEMAEQQAQSMEEARSYQQQARELRAPVEWKGRQAMVDEYTALRRALKRDESTYTTEQYAAEQQRLDALRQEIERRDVAAGNGTRPLTWQDRAGNMLSAFGQRTATALANDAVTMTDAMARNGAYNYDQEMNDFGLMVDPEEQRQRLIEAYESEEAQARRDRMYAAVDRMGESAEADLQKAKNGLGAVGQAGVDIAENLMEMGFDAAVGAMTGGGSLGSMFVRVLGSSAREARLNGATLNEQLAYGLTSAGIEILTEKMADGVAGIYGKGAADEITEELIRKLAQTDTGRSMLRLLIGAVSEGGEEVLSDLLKPFADTIIHDVRFRDLLPFADRKLIPQAYRDQLNAAEMLHDFLLGAAVGAIGGSGNFINGGNARANAELLMRDAGINEDGTFDPSVLFGVQRGVEDAAPYKKNGQNNTAPETGAENTEGAIYEQAGEAGAGGASENRNDGIRAGEQTELPGQGEGIVPGGEGQVREGVQESGGENLRSVTLRELGVTNAAEGATIQVQEERSLSGAAAAAARQVRQMGMEPVAYQGDMIVNGGSVNGYIESGKIFFRTDAKYRDGTAISPDAIVKHEAVHQAKNADPEIIRIGYEIVRHKRSEAQVLAMMDSYRETYQDIYDLEHMSEEEITDRLVEEIVADAYAGLNFFRNGGETVEQVRAAIGSQVESQTAGGQESARAPPRARASINTDFTDKVQAWYDETKPEQRSTSPGYFQTGTTSAALQSIGARADNIYMRKYKIGTILEDHPEMDIGVIKQVPELLENPVLIMKSRTHPDSIVLLGDVKATNGDTVMAALQLTPQPGGNTEAEFSLITSAYGRTETSIQNLIRNSEILYLDTNKNRANNWLMQLRVQFPSRQPPFGPIGNISYAEDGVKITGKTLQELGGKINSERSDKKAGTTGRASAEVADRRSLEREYRERVDAYQAASNRNDTELQPDLDIIQENIEDGRAAVRKLMEDAQTSEDPESLIARNVMYRSDIGPIDFRWGTPGRGAKFKGGYGLSHIIEKRNAENGRGLEIVDRIIETIAKAEVSDRQFSDNQSDGHYRMRLYYGDITAVLNKDPGDNHWLLTGWENNKTAANATGEVHDSSDATAVTPTRTRRNGDATVSNDSISDSSENSNKNNGNQEKRAAENRAAHRETADAFANGEFKGIDIMPEEGEEEVSSPAGFTDEERRGMEMTNALFGRETTSRQERDATEEAAAKGNQALQEFIDSMPEDPMDLYMQQNPVSSKKSVPGEEKMSAEKKPEKKTLRERVSDNWHSFLRNMVNEGDAIHQIGLKTGNKALDGMYFYAKTGTMRAQQWIQKQRRSFDTERSGASLNDIFDPIRAKGDEYYEKFQLYLYHMLNVERMSRSNALDEQIARETLNQLLEADHTLGSMSDTELSARAIQYEEGGGLGYEDEKGELIHQFWEAKKALYRAERAQNKPVFGYDVDADMSREAARDLLAANPEFEELAKSVYDYIDDLLQYRVDTGLITEANKQKLKEMYPHYVPVMYTISEEESDDRIRKGNVQVSSTVKKAKGGNQKLEPLHLALARQTLAAMKNAGYQALGAELLREDEINGSIMGRYVTNLEESDAVWDESMADNDDIYEPHENVIGVLQDGKRYDLTLSDDLSYAFQSLQDGKTWKQDIKPMMKANNLFKKLCTAYNPLFVVYNFAKDVQESLFYSTDTARWIRNYPKAWAQIKGNGKYWQAYQSMGGVQNTYFDWATGENADKRNKLARYVEGANLWIEQAPRLAEYMTVLENAERKNGEVTQADRMEAFNAAAEITTNFSRTGTMGKWVNRNLVPFWNPGVQGLSKAVRTATETKGFKAWALLALKAAALGMAPAFINGLLYRDDDEWDTIDDQIKMEYYLFKTKDGVWVKVPKGRVLAALSMPVVGAQEAARGDEVHWGELMKQAFGSVAPNNPLQTNIAMPFIQAQLFDKDDPGKTWYGSDIESRRLQSYAPGQRYDESTDIISKWLGGKLNLSPKKIHYILDQYSGVIGDLVLPYLTPKADRGAYVKGVAVPFSNAFMSRFTLDTVTNNTISEEYYGLLDELGYAAKGGDKPSAIAERYMNRAGGQVSELYAQIREIENDPELTDEEKTELTRELRKQLNEYEQQVIADAQEYLTSAREYMDEHPEFDYSAEQAVDEFVEGYNGIQPSESSYIDADRAAEMMKDEVYREVNRQHFGAEYALQVYNKDVYQKAKGLHEESGLSYDDFYDYYFGTRYLYADRDEEGKAISGTQTDKIVSFLEGMDISDEQRNAIYHAANHSWNYPAGITEYLKEHPEYDFTSDRLVRGYMESYNSQLTDEKDYITYSGAKSKMRREAYREIYREQYGAEYALQFFDDDVYDKAQGLNTDVDLDYEDFYDFYFGTRNLRADRDENGNSISGSKKEKVVAFIDAMDITDEQKDALYLAAGYKENSLDTTPWNGGSGKYTKSGRGGRGGGRGAKTKAVKGSGSIQLPKASGANSSNAGKSTGGMSGGADASLSLIEIIDKYYGGNALAAAMDGGAKARGRTKLDFKL